MVGLSKMAAIWLQNRLIPNNELLDPVLIFRSARIIAESPSHPPPTPPHTHTQYRGIEGSGGEIETMTRVSGVRLVPNVSVNIKA